MTLFSGLDANDVAAPSYLPKVFGGRNVGPQTLMRTTTVMLVSETQERNATDDIVLTLAASMNAFCSFFDMSRHSLRTTGFVHVPNRDTSSVSASARPAKAKSLINCIVELRKRGSFGEQ